MVLSPNMKNDSKGQEAEKILQRSLSNEMISPEQLHTIITHAPRDLVLLDIRCQVEYREGIIPGALLFPNDHNLENREDTSIFRQCFECLFKPEKFDSAMRYILICRSGPRTEIALEAFLEHGFSACELVGGMLE
ncbi:MAG: Rhodanese domain protein [Magnetococcales bacterium]|nr:Rhodanese domain protein [Magnetococcales bacterium]